MTRQQRWAQGALSKVSAQRNTTAEPRYRTLCLKMPVLIQQSGLVQAIAFVRSREKDLGKGFCRDLAVVAGRKDDAALQEEAQQAGLASYLTLSKTLIDVSIWFRRFAQSELKTPEGPDA